jgi:hypothetical protein
MSRCWNVLRNKLFSNTNKSEVNLFSFYLLFFVNSSANVLIPLEGENQEAYI